MIKVLLNDPTKVKQVWRELYPKVKHHVDPQLIQVFEQVCNRHDSHECYLYLGHLYRYNGQLDHSFTRYKKALLLSPSNGLYLYQLGIHKQSVYYLLRSLALPCPYNGSKQVLMEMLANTDNDPMWSFYSIVGCLLNQVNLDKLPWKCLLEPKPNLTCFQWLQIGLIPLFLLEICPSQDLVVKLIEMLIEFGLKQSSACSETGACNDSNGNSSNHHELLWILFLWSNVNQKQLKFPLLNECCKLINEYKNQNSNQIQPMFNGYYFEDLEIRGIFQLKFMLKRYEKVGLKGKEIEKKQFTKLVENGEILMDENHSILDRLLYEMMNLNGIKIVDGVAIVDEDIVSIPSATCFTPSHVSHPTIFAYPTSTLFVMDTNVFLKNLNQIKQFIQSNSGQIVVPLAVCMELKGICQASHHKATVAKSSLEMLQQAHQNKQIQIMTIAGNRVNNWTIFAENWDKVKTADDAILTCCMNIKGILVTGDLNLKLKARTKGIVVETMKSLIKNG